MRIIPLASETLGVRSMATFVETKDVNILIDPGLSVVSLLHSLPPTPFELRALFGLRKRIRNSSKDADIIIITHYHNDHFSMNPSIYRGKDVFIKDPERFISNNQRKRAERLIKTISKVAKIYYAKKDVRFGDTRIKFSPLLTHGITKKMGGVVSVFIEEKIRFLYSSDVQGFPEEEQVSFLLENPPDIVFFDGPTDETLPLSLINLSRIMDGFKDTTWVMDHHPFRFLDWCERYSPLISLFEEKGILLKTFASFLSLKEELLEAERRIFYESIEEIGRRIWK